MLIKRGLLLAAAGLLTVSQAQDVRDIKPAASRGTHTVATRPAILYPESAKEFYFTDEQTDYIRPGYNITINSITIPADNRPLIDLSFKDDKGQPLDRLGNVTPGTLSASMVLAWWDPVERHYTAYTTRVQTSPITGVSATQAAADANGTFTDLELGHATYKFRTALPASYDKTKTHTLGIYATRNMAGIQDKNYFANVVLPFRPDNAPVTEVWDKTVTAACNNCHNPLGLHGGSRREVGLCVLCHQPQTKDPDTGNTVDFKVMVHKIHMGENLPSVKAGTPYVIIGNAQSVNDFSTVVFPQDIRNCAKCHAAPATQAPNWYSFPSRAACASCHDDVDWVTGAKHPAGPQADDSQCASCHLPQGDREYDASIKGAHTVPYKSTQLKGINATILSVTDTAPGQKPTIKFQLKQNDGTPINPASLAANLNVLMGGSTTDYGVNPLNFRQRADGASFDGTTATYTFTNAIPADAHGTWAFGLEARRAVTLNPAPVAGPATVNESAFNPVYYAAVTDATPVPRRKAVDVANCNVCHDQLAPHGRGRRNTELCVICHNPNESDRRPAALFPPEAIDFKRMIHRIHTGEDLTQDFTIIGTSGNPDNFNEVRFPGDRRDCVKCHVPAAYQVKDVDPPGLLPTNTLRDYYAPQQHYAAACLGCHDTRAAAAHAFVMTAPFGESCAACHGNAAEFAVDKVHAR
jgi:OmcA/MtrC family decaheme c-type cytochrome